MQQGRKQAKNAAVKKPKKNCCGGNKRPNKPTK